MDIIRLKKANIKDESSKWLTSNKSPETDKTVTQEANNAKKQTSRKEQRY